MHPTFKQYLADVFKNYLTLVTFIRKTAI